MSGVEFEIEIEFQENSDSIPVDTFVGVPPPGLPGQFLAFDNTWQYPDAAVSTLSKKAQGTLSGHRVVYSFSPTHVAYANPTDYLQIGKVLGMTTGAAADGEDVVVQDKGILIEPGWAWNSGDIFLAANGQLTQVLPTAGFLFRVGVALSPTAVQLNFDFIAQLA